ncbi:MAG: hypothetical protein IKV38_02450 [Clostridia bacterium]|nr:hypothetical protein [Clostridia bacterium]
MDTSEIYLLVLCLVVLFGLVAFFLYFLTVGLKQRIKLINYGEEDKEIKTQYQKDKKPNVFDKISQIFSILVTVILCVVFAFSMYVNLTEEKKANGIPSLKVVRSASMSYKNSKNQYLVDNDLNDQLQVYDLVITRHLPDEFDLKLYDIVVYQAENGDMIIHRIVAIEEPNSQHPEHRHFKLQGDAIMYADTYPVLYSQMRGIYQGERLPFVGSFIMFMQSPAGIFCIALIVLSVIGLPVVEKRVEKVKRDRYAVILATEQALATNATDDFALNTNPFAHLIGRRDDRTFDQKLEDLPIMSQRYAEIEQFINQIKGVRVILGKKSKTFKVGNKPIAKFTIRGKTLNCYIALKPELYQDTKYVYADFSAVKSYKNYPMRVKATSNRQVKWIKELVVDVVKGAGYEF